MLARVDGQKAKTQREDNQREGSPEEGKRPHNHYWEERDLNPGDQNSSHF